MKKILRIFEKIKEPKIAYAHCDVPCGVYETDTMKHGAQTIINLVRKINARDMPDQNDKDAIIDWQNFVSRSIAVKEEWAHKVKTEALILWTDHFKEEHLEKVPDLHTKIWKLTKLCSQVKRSVSEELALELQKQVAELSEIFEHSKH